MKPLNRRKFLAVIAGSLAATALPGCASSLVAVRLAPENGVLRLSLDEYPQLAEPGGALRVQPETTTIPLYVLALEGGGYAALSPICAHAGCTVDIVGPHLICPCHGSAYDREGWVVRGPARSGLARFPTRLTPENELIIYLEDRT